ncbi:ATP-dependent helicase [Paraflavitalea soli]|uniref:DNA 3'-5' helicase n=1 Tax=Paraflavitalea soli TaxID=2315862 RepID=A0A3B7MHA0_9BACT|nr:ATP-dependent helicase [Paraflavitalea soli]AXY72693.1 ATP-dependent helicase [Paraflavitalea soli]
MKKYIREEDWVPADNMHMERAAHNAIRETGNSLIVAGPGSGKTELLAQKATFLLQTGRCPWPKKILAISFKVDAANNLRDRVQMRCGQALARRFDSMTFDAFSKSIFDRYRRGLPEGFKVQQYNVNLKMKQAIEAAFLSVDEEFARTANVGNQEKYLTARQFPLSPNDQSIAVLGDVWRHMLRQPNPDLNFQMIMRLTDYILMVNPKVKAILQQTYSHIFLDEFQDTTDIQYDFLKTCFLNSPANFTAVGDDKQTIMGWAGAKEKIFETYSNDTKARPFPLTMNWRSAPRLIRFQNYLVDQLLKKPAIAVPSDLWGDIEGEVRMCFFPDHNRERQYLLDQISGWLKNGQLAPRNICILVKQKTEYYSPALIELFSKHGIKARDETELQDLLTEPFPVFIADALELVFSSRSATAWDNVFRFLVFINQSYEDDQMLSLRRKTITFFKNARNNFNNGRLNSAGFNLLIGEIAKYANIKKVKDNYPQYKDGKWLRKIMEAMTTYLLKQYTLTGNMLTALDALRGADTIPIMTIHKSKGLEFHTVIFVGLEDSAFWSYQTSTTPDNNTFFVALSRAKERVLFTFCQTRPLPTRGGGTQYANGIQQIHQLINNFSEIDIHNEIS